MQRIAAVCFLDKELLCWLPATLEGAQARAVATMTDSVLPFASFAAAVNGGGGRRERERGERREERSSWRHRLTIKL